MVDFVEIARAVIGRVFGSVSAPLTYIELSSVLGVAGSLTSLLAGALAEQFYLAAQFRHWLYSDAFDAWVTSSEAA